MKAAPGAVPASEPVAYQAVLSAGVLCGVLDLAAAFVSSGLRGASPIRVLQFIGSGILGRPSFDGGVASASLGLLSHFLIAFSASAAFYAASRKLDFLTQRAVISGIVYGVLVYFFMNRIVVPLSAAPRLEFSVVSLFTGLGIHMVCVGLPISLIVRKYSKHSGSHEVSLSLLG
jgi:hypothetical protein